MKVVLPKLSALVFCGFLVAIFLNGCSSECQTCTKEGEESVDICEEDYNAGTVAFSYERILMVQEDLGWECN